MNRPGHRKPKRQGQQASPWDQPIPAGSAVPRRPPMPDEPYCPPAPPYPPTLWTQQQWDRWWGELARWCEYRVRVLQEDVPRLNAPPRVNAPISFWDVWWRELRRWGLPFDARVEWPPFPEGWTVRGAEEELSCQVCRRRSEVGECPQCQSLVCRECLYLSQDRCPVDFYAPDR